jgi:hypothetical protein
VTDNRSTRGILGPTSNARAPGTTLVGETSMRFGHPCSLEIQSLVVYESTASRDSIRQRALRSCGADFNR